jgi:hypothetical protein
LALRRLRLTRALRLLGLLVVVALAAVRRFAGLGELEAGLDPGRASLRRSEPLHRQERNSGEQGGGKRRQFGIHFSQGSIKRSNGTIEGSGRVWRQDEALAAAWRRRCDQIEAPASANPPVRRQRVSPGSVPAARREARNGPSWVVAVARELARRCVLII